MDFIYLGLAAACGLAIWGLALFCHHLTTPGNVGNASINGPRFGNFLAWG